MQTIILVSVSLLLIVFGIALHTKAVNFTGFADSLSSFGLPSSTLTLVGFGTLGAEALALIALLVLPLRLAGIYCLALLSIFTIVSGFTILRGRHPQCQCFGNLTSGSIGRHTVLRNVLLAGIAAVLLTEPETLGTLIESSDPQTLVTSTLSMMIAGLMAVLYTLLTRYGEVLHTLDALGVDTVTRKPRKGLISGERIPDMTLLDWDGHPVALAEEIRKDSSTGLVLLSATCGHCDELVPALENAADLGFPGLVILQGKWASAPEQACRIRDSGWPVLFTETEDVSDRLQIAGFPALIPLDERGNAKGGTLLGRQRIESFLESELSTPSLSEEREQSHDRQDSQEAQSTEQGVAII